MDDQVKIIGNWMLTLTEEDGAVTRREIKNVVTSAGMNALASRAIADTSSPFGWLAVGTATAVHSIGSVVTGFGEVLRKAGSTITTSKERIILVMSLGGASDGLTGVPLDSAAIVSDVSSGLGTALSMVNSVNTTLGASDTLLLEVAVRVGSHNL